MNKKYLLILPNVYIGEPFIMGNITLQRFGSENEELTDNKNKDLLVNVQQMLINNGFSGIFTYCYFASTDSFQKIVLDMRKTMALFKYVVFEKHPELSLESLIYYLLESTKVGEEIPEMRYSLEGLQDGNRHIHFWAPGSREVVKRINYPQILYLDNEHLLIQEFNLGELKDTYIIAIERFNRTFKKNYDPVEDILNLTTAFEHILEEADTANLFAKSLIQAFGLELPNLGDRYMNLAKNLEEWGKEFYKVRGQVSHGNAFQHYTEKRSYEYWEDCFKWKHPNGTSRYINHNSIAKKIFKLIIEKLLKGGKIENGVMEGATPKMKSWMEQVEYQIIESDLEPLITPNEIYYRKLKEFVDSKEPFGILYYEIIWRIKQYDGTEEKSVLLYLLKHFLTLTESRFPDLKEVCDEIKKLIEGGKDTALMGLKTIKLSQMIDKKDSDKKVIDDKIVYNSNLSQFLEKVYYSLTHIAWQEKK